MVGYQRTMWLYVMGDKFSYMNTVMEILDDYVIENGKWKVNVLKGISI